MQCIGLGVGHLPDPCSPIVPLRFDFPVVKQAEFQGISAEIMLHVTYSLHGVRQ